MVNTIDEAFVEQFRSNVYQLSQQRGSRLGMCVRFESLIGNFHNFERLGSVIALESTGTRHSDSPILDAPHSRRRVSPRDFEWGDVVDREDKLRLIISPESEYAIAGANALGRTKDDLIIEAFVADAINGDNSAAPFPGTGDESGLVIAPNSEGLTLDKILAGLAHLNLREVPDEDRYFTYGSAQLTEILTDDKFTSADFNTVRTLMAGQVTTYLGLTWIRSERLEVDLIPTPDVRSCIMWYKQSMGIAVNEDMFARIAERADLSFAWQVYCRLTMGATRIEEAGVVQIDCDEGT